MSSEPRQGRFDNYKSAAYSQQWTCPIVQGSSKLWRNECGPGLGGRWVSDDEIKSSLAPPRGSLNSKPT